MPPRRRGSVIPAPTPRAQTELGVPRIPRPFVYEAFPELLRPIHSVPQEVLMATREQHWRERAARIRDDSMSWTQCTREWKEAQQMAEEERDPALRSRRERRVQVCRIQADREQMNLARRIYFEGTDLERARMPPYPSSPPVEFIFWAKGEAKFGNPRGKAWWECIMGLQPTSVPHPPPQSRWIPPVSVTGASKGLKPNIGISWVDDRLKKSGGRFWALQCLDEEDSCSEEEIEQEPCNPYLATIGDALNCAQKQSEKMKSKRQRPRMDVVASCLKRKAAQIPENLMLPDFRGRRMQNWGSSGAQNFWSESQLRSFKRSEAGRRGYQD